MKFNNEQTVYSIHVVKLTCAVFILLVLTLLLITRLDEIIYNAIGLNQTWILVILITLYLLLLLYFRLRKTSYFAYNDDGSRIVIKSYRIGAGSSKKMLFEIPKSNFYQYEIEKRRLSEEISFYIKIGGKISKYPPVSISTITRVQKEKMLNQLCSLSNK